MEAGVSPGIQAGILEEQFSGKGHDYSILASLAKMWGIQALRKRADSVGN